MKNKLGIAFLAIFVLTFSSTGVKASELENIVIEIDEQDQQTIEINDKENKVIQEIEAIFGSMDEFYKVGNFYVDENKNIHINYKNGNDHTKKALKNLQNIQMLNDNENIQIREVTYSTSELQEIQEEIVNTIHPANVTGRYFSVSYSEEKQNITIEHANQIPNEVLEELKNKFPGILEIKVTQESPEFLKTKKQDWNNLGAGLGITNGLSGGACSTAGVVYKDSKYFLLTAGHCFEGSTVSSGSAAGYVKQYYTNVGRMHSTAIYNQLDAGLVRLEGSSIPRKVTHGIKVSPGTNDNTEVFDNKFVGWKGMYIGMSVCKSGITTNKTCGTIHSNQIMEIGGKTYKMTLVESDNGGMFADGGDSGSPVYQADSSGNYLTGILSGRIGANNQYGLIVDILGVRDTYGVSLYTTSAITPITN